MAVFGPVDKAIGQADRILTEALVKAAARLRRLVDRAGPDMTAAEFRDLVETSGYYRDIKEILSANGYEPIAESIGGVIENEAIEVLKQYGLSPKDSLGGLANDQVLNLVDKTKTAALAYPDVAIEAQKKALLAVSTGQFSVAYGASVLEGALGLTASQSLVAIDQNLSSASQWLNNNVAVSLGLNIFEYGGAGPDSVMRDWCYSTLVQHGQGLAPGQYRIEEISQIPWMPRLANPMAPHDGVDEYPGPWPYDPFTHRGGWRCRHFWFGVH